MSDSFSDDDIAFDAETLAAVDNVEASHVQSTQAAARGGATRDRGTGARGGAPVGHGRNISGGGGGNTGLSGSYHHRVAPHARPPLPQIRPPPPPSIRGMLPGISRPPASRLNTRPPHITDPDHGLSANIGAMPKVNGFHSKHLEPLNGGVRPRQAPPPPRQEEEEDEFPDFAFKVNDLGGYEAVKDSRQVEQDGLRAAVLPAPPLPAQPPRPAPHAPRPPPPPPNSQRPFSRSISHPHHPSPPASQFHPPARNPEPTSSQNPYARKPMVRAVSTAAGEARRAAIMMELSGSQEARAGSQGAGGAAVGLVERDREKEERMEVDEPVAGPSRMRGESVQAAGTMHTAGAGVEIGTGGGGGGVGSEEFAKIQAEMEKMKQQVKELEEQKAQAERAAKEAKQEIYKFQGEASTVRRKLDEQTKAHGLLAEKMKLEFMELEEKRKRQEEDAKQQMDKFKTVAAFQTHTLMTTSASKARFPASSQRPSTQVRATPARQGFAMGTPSKSPSRKGGRVGELGMLGRVDEEFGGTPGWGGRLGGKGKGKAKHDMGPPAAASPAFKNLVNSFTMDPDTISRAAKRPRMNAAPREPTASPTSPAKRRTGPKGPASSFPARGDADLDSGFTDEGMGDGDVEMDDGVMGMEVEEGGMEVDGEAGMDDVQKEERDFRSQVLHLLFTHRYIPALASSSSSFRAPTLQMILHCQLPDSDGPTKADYSDRCAQLLTTLGDRSMHALDSMHKVADILSGILEVLVFEQQDEIVVCLMRLLAALPLQIAHWFQDRVLASFSPTLLSEITGRLATKKDVVPGMAVAGTEIQTELALALCDLVSSFCWGENLLDARISDFAGSCLYLLLQPCQHIDVVLGALDLAGMMLCHETLFRALLKSQREENAAPREHIRSPVLTVLCKYLLNDHGTASDVENLLLRIKTINFLSLLCSRHHDGIPLLGQSHGLVPTLIQVLEREASLIWGVVDVDEQGESPFSLLIPVISLLHYMAFPPTPVDGSPAPPALDLVGTLRSFLTNKDFNGIHHMFIVAMGRISYADCELVADWKESEIRALQYLAQDLLEAVVEGPEGDSIYELYVMDVKGTPARSGHAAEDEDEVMANMAEDM